MNIVNIDVLLYNINVNIGERYRGLAGWHYHIRMHRPQLHCRLGTQTSFKLADICHAVMALYCHTVILSSVMGQRPDN